MKSRIHLPLIAAFLLGVGLGAIGVFSSHLDESRFGADYSKYRLETLASLSLPGEIIDEALLGRDYRLGEQWILGKFRIPLLNGACFALVLLPFLVVIRRQQSQKK